MRDVSRECKELLLRENVDALSSVDFDVNGEVYSMTFEYVIDAFAQSSNESQLVFVSALEKALKAKESGAIKFFEEMGQLLLMTHLSEKFEV